MMDSFMRGMSFLLLVLVLLSASASGHVAIQETCPPDDWAVTESTVMAGGLECFVKDDFEGRPEELGSWKEFDESSNSTHHGAGAWIIEADNVELDCNGTILSGIGYRRGDNTTRFRFGIFSYGRRNVTVKNCILKGYADGILFINAVGSRIYNNWVSDSDNGIVLDNTIPEYYEEFERTIPHYSAPGSNEVFNNTLVGNLQGLNLVFSDNNSLHHNTVMHSLKNGIQLEGSSYNVVAENHVGGSAEVAFLIYGGSNSNLLSRNTAINHSMDYRLYDSSDTAIVDGGTPLWRMNLDLENATLRRESAGCPVDDTRVYGNLVLPGNLWCNVEDLGGPGVLFIAQSDIILDCNGTTFNGTGIEPPDVFKFAVFSNRNDNVTIRNCGVENYGDGILVMNGEGLKVTGNHLHSNDNGIVLDTVRNSEASGNALAQNGRGILLLFSDANRIADNTVRDGEDGIQLDGSRDNHLIGNTIEETERAVWMKVGPGHGNLIEGNALLNNRNRIVEYEKRSFTITTPRVEPTPQTVVVRRGEYDILDKVVTPGDKIELEGGSYVMTFTAEGHESSVQRIDLTADMDIPSVLVVDSSLKARLGAVRERLGDALPLTMLAAGLPLLGAFAWFLARRRA